MKTFTLLVGATYGLLSIILGAFGAHAFKKVLSPEKLSSFEIGVKYQMYAALFLLLIGFCLKLDNNLEKWTALLMVLGGFLFSVSIYLLAFQEVFGVSLKFLGPVTPLGGLLMILSWGLLIITLAKGKLG